MSNLLDSAKSLLDSIYPEISSLSTVSIPSSVVIDGSTYKIPAIALPTPSSSSASTTSSSASSTTSGPSSTTAAPSTTDPPQTSIDLNRTPTTPTASPAATELPKHSPDRRLGIILGVLLPLLAILIALAILWYVYRRKKRTGYWLKHKPPPSDEEVDAWRGNEKPTSSFFVRPLNHTSHIWSDHSSNGRYQPLDNNSGSTMTAAEPTRPLVAKSAASPKTDEGTWSGASGLPGGTGAPYSSHITEREVSPDTNAAAPLAAGAAAGTGAAASAPKHPRPLSSSPLSGPPITAPSAAPAIPTSQSPSNNHNARNAAAAAGLGGLAGLAAARHARKASTSRSRSRHGRKSTERPTDLLTEQPLEQKTSSNSDEYHTPPEDLAGDMVVNDGPYARARRASWGTSKSPKRSSRAEEQMQWRQSRDRSIEPVPDPYMSSGAGKRESWGQRGVHPAERASPFSNDAAPEERAAEGERGRPPTPLMHDMFGRHPAPARGEVVSGFSASSGSGSGSGGDGSGATTSSAAAASAAGLAGSSDLIHRERAGTNSSLLSKRSTISRKPVPAPIRTQGLQQEQAYENPNPFASPQDDYAEHSPGPYGGAKMYPRRSGAYARGDYEEDYGPTPLLPPRSPERRYSPSSRGSGVHYPSGAEVGQFDFGLSKEELRSLREAGERRSMSVDREGGERTWSFERGHGV
ncbi:hypothetical protein C1H76_5408 [Elsinoe australis]|uniref:Uncharacterized protein n=1 Tax=Elsinoe australis TaxID=40998 RepID=A0A4U7B023_9PEZI|nr:hypothetical protein C1H76_5408 [Elsinoe australis]